MGSRGAFVNVDIGNFDFVEDGQTYHSIGEVDGIKILVRDSGSVKAPELSHTQNSAYAIIQDGYLKHLAWYDEEHNQKVCIDFLHSHKGLKPHKHLNLDHSDQGISPTDKELEFANKIRRRFNLK